ncbi:MAG TPA: M50 family metallopeptidase [Candidatus Paceibacterota bacterium]|nr:M50 family metallopeptidase [Candidatus Paceibacterota bacterium]
MYLALAIGLVLLSLVLHELAHAFWMRRYGLPIRRFGIGIPVPGLTLRFRVGETDVSVSPLVIGAFVATDDKAMQKLPWREQADIYGGGPWANIVFGATCITATCLLVGSWRPLAIGTVIASAAIAILPRTFGRYLVPAAGPFLLALLLGPLFLAPDPTEQVAGPVGIVQILNEHSFSLVQAFWLSGVLSVSIALMNMLPLYPLDAGRTVIALLKTRWPGAADTYAGLSTVAMFLLFLFVMYADITKLFR